MVYAVIDTNVIVASLLTKHHDSATARVMDAVFSGKVIPLLNDEIVAEYRDVLHRKRLGLNPEKCDFIISFISDLGLTLDRISMNIPMTDEKDRVFYEIALAGLDMGNSRLVTGNIKSFPITKRSRPQVRAASSSVSDRIRLSAAAAERESAKADEHEQAGGRLWDSNPRTCSLSAKAKRGVCHFLTSTRLCTAVRSRRFFRLQRGLRNKLSAVAQGIPHCCTMG